MPIRSDIMSLFVKDNTKNKRAFDMFSIDLNFIINSVNFKIDEEIKKDKDEFDNMARIAFKEYANGDAVNFSILDEKVKQIEKKEISMIRNFSKKLIDELKNRRIIKKISSKEALIPSKLIGVLSLGYQKKGFKLFS
jgi:hypothetical protein